jgi:hypothetical protein
MSPGAPRKLVGSELERLCSLRARCGGAAAPTALEVEQALESGFASLMTLEARLQRARTAARTGNSRAGEEERSVQPLVDEIEVLRDELTKLRAATSSDASSSPLAWGFVLPSDTALRAF